MQKRHLQKKLLCAIVLLLLSHNLVSEAGISFAPQDNALTTLPEFHSRGEAIKFANQVGGNDIVRRALRDKIKELRQEAQMGTEPTQYQIQRAGQLMTQVDYLEMAMATIINLIKHHVGAEFYAGSIPL